MANIRDLALVLASSLAGKLTEDDQWKLVFKGKTVVHKNKTFWWCSKHDDGKGMYVCHPPEDHDKCRAAQAAQKASGGKFTYIPPDPLRKPSVHTTTGAGDEVKPPPVNSGDSDTGTLELGNELKQVLATFGLSDSDAEYAISTAFARAKKD